MNLKPSHRLGDCPNGVEWCDPQDHLCEDCYADYVDRVYEWGRELAQGGPNDDQPVEKAG